MFHMFLVSYIINIIIAVILFIVTTMLNFPSGIHKVFFIHYHFIFIFLISSIFFNLFIHSFLWNHSRQRQLKCNVSYWHCENFEQIAAVKELCILTKICCLLVSWLQSKNNYVVLYAVNPDVMWLKKTSESKV